MKKAMNSCSQISFFEIEESECREARWRRIYNLWLEMPDTRFIDDKTADRENMHGKYAFGSDYWLITRQINHTCGNMPENMYVWLNTCEPPEYWVLTQRGIAESGKHIEVCPYCGANLKNGRGAAVIYKDQRRHHWFPATQ